MVGQWPGQVKQPQRSVADQLGRGQVRPGPPDRAEQRDRRGHPRHPDQRHRPPGRQRRHQPQPYPGQHCERALAAAEQPGQVVAGGVLERAVHPGQQRAARQRELGADQLGAGPVPSAAPAAHRRSWRSRRRRWRSPGRPSPSRTASRPRRRAAAPRRSSHRRPRPRCRPRPPAPALPAGGWTAPPRPRPRPAPRRRPDRCCHPAGSPARPPARTPRAPPPPRPAYPAG